MSAACDMVQYEFVQRMHISRHNHTHIHPTLLLLELIFTHENPLVLMTGQNAHLPNNSASLILIGYIPGGLS